MSAIVVENLGKRYVIGHQVRHDTLRDSLAHGARNLLHSLRRSARTTQEEFWALRDVSFTVEPGEVVGIVGRNGAGKSTLLKILSRITEPTQGRITLKGRVASLLEVGTGFHPELTGRENIYLNGAILGMSRAEIRAKFDEIVAFSEVERFLDTPVKRYSSGMYVRLAFAVAAHLEPEILIVDEVLAVGDVQFQKKCIGKMQDVATCEGRTVLFVSHNLAAVGALCSRSICLQSGRIISDGKTPEVLNRFLQEDSPVLAELATPFPSFARPGYGVARFDHVRIADTTGFSRNSFEIGETFHIEMTVLLHQPLPDLVVGWHIANVDHQVIVCSNHHDSPHLTPLSSGRHQLRCIFSGLGLAPGSYRLTFAATSQSQHGVQDHLVDCLSLEILPIVHGHRAEDQKLLDGRPGLIRKSMQWIALST